MFKSVREAFGGRLEYVICGGAVLDPFYIREFRSWGIEILNGYGTTEWSPCVAVNRNLCHKDGTVGHGIRDGGGCCGVS
ncbi:MAG: AMP-binding protein [Acetatifactor sp.]|nr:AMP-binding protein [Acetatifactor sp.]